MILTNEEKRTAWIAAGGGAAVLLIYFVGLPLWNRWTALGAALEPKVLLLERLEERANAQNALLARRDELAREIGAVEGRPTPLGAAQGMPAGPAQGGPVGQAQGGPPSAQPPATEKSDKSKPAASGSSRSAVAATASISPGPAAAPPAPTAPPPHAVSVAAYVERQAGTVGIRFNSVTPFTPTLGYKDGKSLAPAGVVVTLETATPAFLRLLYALEKGDRLMRIERMDIHRDIRKGPIIVATLHIVGYEAAGR